MTTTVHSTMTGADLHEPKGTASALSGEVYVANGAGSGVWTPAASVVLNTAFSTGDLKPTHKTTADTTWILWVDGTIGDGSSSGTVRANADTAALFALYWTYGNTLCPIAGGYGVSAAADYAAHKAISLPLGSGRVLGLAGSGSGLTTRVVGASVGEETHLLALTEVPAHTHANVLSDPGHGHSVEFGAVGSGSSVTTITNGSLSGNTTGVVLSNTTGVSITNQSQGGGLAHNNMQPTAFINVMIKL